VFGSEPQEFRSPNFKTILQNQQRLEKGGHVLYCSCGADDQQGFSRWRVFFPKNWSINQADALSREDGAA